MKHTPKQLLSLEKWKVVALFLILYDAAATAIAYFLALFLRFDFMYSEIPEEFLLAWARFAPIYAVLVFLVMHFLRLYRSLWQFASYNELWHVLLSSAITAPLHILGISLLFARMPVSYYLLGAVLQFLALLSVRFSFRLVLLLRRMQRSGAVAITGSRVLLVGAGAAGQLILRDINTARKVPERVVCLIDDDSNKWGRYIDGIPIVGGRDDILLAVERYKIDKIYLAIPSASPSARRDILSICNETSCELKTLPGIYQSLSGTIGADSMREIALEDLLGRETVRVEMDEIREFVSGKVVLVTGGGGSIGSELCRQIATFHPKQLVIFDIYENNAHAIALELQDRFPRLDVAVLIGSVRDSKRIEQVFRQYKPYVVYHAAAHKHVPLMEGSPCEAIKNNTIGTYKTAYAAMKNGCRRFVLISTDKAVNPTNIMGASKRLCEMIVQTFDKRVREGRADSIPPLYGHGEEEPRRPARTDCFTPSTEFVAVRFGNVLGSNGSVIPRFREQIARGGPVTVTHPDIIRYFMTIPEAASLVLEAGTYAHGGEIFVLDMGSPVKIDTLARNLIKLSGLRPDEDIPIVYTGLRPGEKLYEEKLMSEEGLRTTPNRLIHIGCPIPFDEDVFLKKLPRLLAAACDGREDEIRSLVTEVCPTFRPAGEHGSEEKGAAFDEQMKLVGAGAAKA